MTNMTLTAAEARIAPATALAQSMRRAIVEAMREEIGQANYETAKVKLLELEQSMATLYRPFLDQVVAMQAQTHAPVLGDMRGWLREMMDICALAPKTLRDGIAGWDGLTVPLQADGRTLDITVRSQRVYDIRVCLRNWDNQLGRLKDLKDQVERRIVETQWPASQTKEG